MKRLILLVLVFNIGAFAQLSEQEKSVIKQIALKAHEDYAAVLRNAMKNKLQKEGAAKAIEYCYNNANSLTMRTSSKLSRKLKVKIKLKRVSFKNRNPYNYPNVNEEKILKQLQQNKIDEKETVIADYKHEVMSFQPLYVKKVCLKCHGGNLGADVKKALKKYYATDKAVGFEEGDFRGAIVVTVDKKSLKKHLQND